LRPAQREEIRKSREGGKGWSGHMRARLGRKRKKGKEKKGGAWAG